MGENNYYTKRTSTRKKCPSQCPPFIHSLRIMVNKKCLYLRPSLMLQFIKWRKFHFSKNIARKKFIAFIKTFSFNLCFENYKSLYE